MPKARVVIATAGIAFGLAVGGVGTAAATPATRPPSSVPGKSASPTAWTHTVCQSVSKWESKVKGLNNSFQSQLQGVKPGSGEVAAVRKLLAQFLQKTIDSTKQLVQQLDGAGTPKVDQGKAIEQFFHDGFTQVKDLLTQALKNTKSLPNDQQAFTSGEDAISTQIRDGFDRIGAVFNDAKTRFNAPEVGAAFSADPVCSSL